MDSQTLVVKQREYFLTGATRSMAFRMDALRKLRRGIQEQETDLLEALRLDLNKSGFEGYMSEIGMVLSEIRHCLKHVRAWAKDKRVATPLAQFSSKSFVVAEPYGVVLIMSPWNYPVQLCLEPLVGAIMAGNCAVIKPSAYAPHTSAAIARLVGKLFPPEYIAVIEGGRAQNEALLDLNFDYIFFTGSVAVGRLVMERAAKNLTPVTLELGGKSPCIVDRTADLAVAARRIAFGKFLNAGQTCVAPDYLYVHRSVKAELVEKIRGCVAEFYPNGDYSNMPVIINEKHFNRLCGLMKDEQIVMGGGTDAKCRFIEPTLIDNCTMDSNLMQEEIFGPIMPILCFETVDEVIDTVNSRPKPLALYLFTSDRAAEQAVLRKTSFGGGCINDTIIHLATSHMGFGGVGESGMGSYHGKNSFDTFTHYKSIVKKATWIDLPMRYLPYTKKNLKLLRMFLK